MGIKENQERVFDLVVEQFSEVSGMRSGIAADTVVYSTNAPSLWMHICLALNIRPVYKVGLITIEDYVAEFTDILRKHNAQREKFLEDLTQFVYQQTGRLHNPKEILFNEVLPHSEDKDQNLREEMAYFLKLGKIKSKIRNKYNFFKESSVFYKAQTLDQVADAICGKKFIF